MNQPKISSMTVLTREHIQKIIERVEKNNRAKLKHDDLILYDEINDYLFKLKERHILNAKVDSRYAQNKKEKSMAKDGQGVLRLLYESLKTRFIITEISDENEFITWILTLFSTKIFLPKSSVQRRIKFST